MRKVFFTPILIVVFTLVTTNLFSQFSISGPTCVVAGVPFQYNVIGPDTSLIKICIQGAKLITETSNCYTSPFLSYTRLIWDTGIVRGTILLRSNSADTSLNVDITTNLTPGNIDSTSMYQFTTKDSIPSSVICSEAAGGHCSPSYLYQWQQSGNAQNWVNIEGSNRKDLIFFATPLQTTYYRRRVLEERSNTIDYSAIAMVVIQVPQNPIQ